MNVKHRFHIHKYYANLNKYRNKFQEAIREYGENDFFVTILAKDVPQDKMHELEKEFIEEYDTYSNGYNSNAGGNGVGYGARYRHPRANIDTWVKAEELWEWWNKRRITHPKGCGAHRMSKTFDCSCSTCTWMKRAFENGWIPARDNDFLKWKGEQDVKV
jgi:hypothetical protein